MLTAITRSHGRYRITTDRSLLDVAAVHRYLSEESYWAQNIPLDLVVCSFENSFVVGVLHGEDQIGYARLVTDYSTFGYLADVYILTEHRGHGLSKAMMELIMELPWVQGLRRLMLGTADAHGLYAQYGFLPPARPDRLMEIVKPNPYRPATSAQDLPPTTPPVNEP